MNAITVSIVPLLPGEYQLFIYHRGDKFFTGQPLNVTGNEIVAEEVISKVGLLLNYSFKLLELFKFDRFLGSTVAFRMFECHSNGNHWKWLASIQRIPEQTD